MSARTFELAGLYTSERKRLHKLIHRIVGNRAVAEDVAQDAFVKLKIERLVRPTMVCSSGPPKIWHWTISGLSVSVTRTRGQPFLNSTSKTNPSRIT